MGKKRVVGCYAGKGCFGGGVREEEVEVPGGKKNLELESVHAGGESRTPTHLVVFVNGIIGSASDWKFAAREIVKRFPDDVIAHCSKCNTNTLTLDGIDKMGERLADEVISVIKRRREIQKISFVAHSLGGLIARYAIGRLYGIKLIPVPFKEKMNNEGGELEAKSNQEIPKGKIAGLEAVNFITFATPHVGSRGHKHIPMLCGSRLLERTSNHCSWIFKRTGKHLLFKDSRKGQPPILFQMVNDCGDLKFMSALQCFKRRVAYSNISFDHIVGWSTASIRHRLELPKLHRQPIDEKYPHVVNVEAPKSITNHGDAPLDAEVPKDDIEGAIIRGLNRVGWERVDVSFHRTKQKYFAHTTIQVKTYCINSAGADVVFHMIDNFQL